MTTCTGSMASFASFENNWNWAEQAAAVIRLFVLYLETIWHRRCFVATVHLFLLMIALVGTSISLVVGGGGSIFPCLMVAGTIRWSRRRWGGATAPGRLRSEVKVVILREQRVIFRAHLVDTWTELKKTGENREYDALEIYLTFIKQFRVSTLCYSRMTSGSSLGLSDVIR